MDANNPEYHKIFIDLQQKEAQLNWTRNNYFLATSSLLFLAFSQLEFPVTSILAAAGIAVNIVWLFIQYRSSQYIGYYKEQAENNKPPNFPEIYPPGIGGFQMRYLVYFLPISFILTWSVFVAGDIIRSILTLLG
jgi:hypothetical protein